MRALMLTLATASFLSCTTFFIWTSVHFLRDQGWTVPTWRPFLDVESSQQYNELLAHNHQLQEALRAASKPTSTQLEQVASPSSTELPTATTAVSMAGFAYVFYATTDQYACSVLVNIDRLRHTLHTVIPIHVLATSDVSDAYIAVFQSAGAITHIEAAPPLQNGGGGYYQDCLLKLLAFKMHEVDPTLRRVLAFDSDQLVMRNLDHLFTGLPDVDLAAPRAYWLAKDFLASTFLMICLSDRLWRTVAAALDAVQYDKFDMDLINDLLGDTVMMLSGEYVTLNSHWEDWNLPTWYHPEARLNMTTVELINDLARSGNRWETGPQQQAQADTAAGAREDEGDPELQFIPDRTRSLPTTLRSSAKLPLFPQNTSSSSQPQLLTGQPSLPPVPSSPVSPSDSSLLEILPAPDKPRFPLTHPLTHELSRLQDHAAVIHFTASGKPWMKTGADVQAWKPDAHPVLAEQFHAWRVAARDLCPGGIPGGAG